LANGRLSRKGIDIALQLAHPNECAAAISDNSEPTSSNFLVCFGSPHPGHGDGLAERDKAINLHLALLREYARNRAVLEGMIDTEGVAHVLIGATPIS
jgi:hypothetical protein